MKRGEAGGRIYYRERRWKLSLACFLAAIACAAGLAVAAPGPKPEDSWGGFVTYSAGFLIVALFLQQDRLAIIDRFAGRFFLVERRMIGIFHRQEALLRGIRVRTTSARYEGLLGSGAIRHYIWVQPAAGGRILFKGNLSDQTEVHDLVVELGEDLRGSED